MATRILIMLPITVASQAVSARSLSASILGGSLDAIHIGIEGLTGSGDLEAAADEILKSMSVNGSRLSTDGSTTPFISSMTGDAFRKVGNLLLGYMRALDGALIATGHKVFDADEGVTVRLRWDEPDVADVDASGASIVITRASNFSLQPDGPLALYEGQPVTDTAQRFSTTIPNLNRAFYVGETFEKAKIDVNGTSFESSASFARAASSIQYAHEQADKTPALVLWDSDLMVPANPTVTVYTESAGGVFVQIGQTNA